MPPALLALAYKMLGHVAILSVAASVLAFDIDFRDQITLGTIITAALMVVLAGVFTVRSKVASIWRDTAEAEKARANNLEQELQSAKDRESEHKAEIMKLTTERENLRVKTDLTTALEALKGIALSQAKGHEETHKLLIEIRDRLPQRS